MTAILKNTPSSPLKKEKFFYKNRFVFVAFLIPLLLMIYAFYCAGFFPFGDNQIMVIDMWHQYFPFMKVLHEKLQGGGSFLYTWLGGGGTNFIALISYYAASPLYLLTVFFPTEYLTEAMALIVVLKISCAAAFMFIYLRSMYKRDDIGLVAFAVLYAMSAYAMGYYWCLMWLDVMALLPLCILGLNKLIDEGKFKLYTISLALIMFSNYYIGVMVCMFIALYYPILYFSRVKAKGAKTCAITTAKAIGFSVLGCCMAAVILIPTYLSMQNTYYIDQQFPAENTFYNDILDVLSNMFPNVALTVRGGLPNIYCGVISFMMATLFLMCKKVPAKKRILNCCILFFLILSFNWNKLDFIWHGFHFPNELPYRYSFVFSFIIVSMAAEAYKYLKDITPKQIGGVSAGGFIYIIVAQKLFKETFDYKVIYVALALLAMYAIALAIYKSGKVKQVGCGVLLFIIVFAEMTGYAVKSVSSVGNSNRTTYYTGYDNVEALIDKVESEDDGFYRMEVKNNWTCNDPALYGYNGLTQFSSEINCNVTSMMETLGLAADPGSNSFRYLVQTPIVNTMLNVKYIIARGETLNDPYYKALYKSDDSNIYKSSYNSSIGYVVNDDIKSWAPDATNPFETQNEYVWDATGVSIPVLDEITNYDESSYADNGNLGEYSSGIISCTSSGSTTIAHLVFTAEKTQPVYVYTSVPNAQSISARVDGGDSISLENNRGCIASVGEAKKGQKILIDVTFESGSANDISCMVYGLNTEAWENAYSELNSNMLNVTDHSDTKIEGTVTANKDGVLFTSIPYEKGWSCYIDGKKVNVNAINKAFCSVDIKEGKHTVVFKYIPAGFISGVSLTLVSIIALIAIHFVLKKNDERKKKIALIESTNLFETELVDENINIKTMVEETFNETEEITQDKIDQEISNNDDKPKLNDDGDFII